jgi:hypothetical protein
MADARTVIRAFFELYHSEFPAAATEQLLGALSAAGLVIVPIAELTRIGDGLFEEMSAWNVDVRALLDSNPMQTAANNAQEEHN